MAQACCRTRSAAGDLLGDGRMSISEIALACGFADQSHFTRAFTKATNFSTAAWRRQMLSVVIFSMMMSKQNRAATVAGR